VAVALGALIVAATSAPPAAARIATASRCPTSDAPAREPVDEGDATPGVTRMIVRVVESTCRVLNVAVRVPTGATSAMPLILAVHGRDGDPTALRPLLDAWTAAGYVVAAPYFLVTDKDANDLPTGAAVARQAADARFVLGRLLELARDPSNPLYGLIDPQRVGAAGMSLGGMTVYGLVSNTCCRDPRIGAAILLAAVRRSFPGGSYVRQKVPVLLIQGDRDPGFHNSKKAYPQLAAPKWFIVLHGAQHSPPFELPRGPEAGLVDASTVAFWNRYLRGDLAATGQLGAAVAGSAVQATLRRDAP
jgi:predicted dienelactone hydrolase